MDSQPQKKRATSLLAVILIFSTLACSLGTGTNPTPIPREEAIPSNAVKMMPDHDPFQPVAVPGWSQPEPLSGPVNTAGGEDSPFLTAEGELYFFFTPDVNIPASGQVGDGVTGIWRSERNGDNWTEPQRVLLIEPGEPHLDGCPFVMGDWMAFCSVRAGNVREIDIYTAERVDGTWTNVRNWGEPFNQDYWVGELHIAADGHLYFGSDRPGGLGGIDLWVSRWDGTSWAEPVNLGARVNTSNSENRPFVTSDGRELWFDGPSQVGYPGPAVFRALRQPDGSWGQPEEIISSFAGEPNLSGDGSILLFIHHYFSEDMSRMIEADIYVSYRLEDNP
jgi:hypothetical protein